MNNTLPLKNEQNQRLSRKFLGNLFPENCIEKSELKAYIKGQTHFYYGRDQQGYPRRFEVRQQYFYTN
jgi:hypothetical protein